MFTPDIVVHFRDVSYVISVQSKAAIYFSQCHLQTIDLYCSFLFHITCTFIKLKLL